MRLPDVIQAAPTDGCNAQTDLLQCTARSQSALSLVVSAHTRAHDLRSCSRHSYLLSAGTASVRSRQSKRGGITPGWFRNKHRGISQWTLSRSWTGTADG
eukprot:1143579-Pelagomonas_calceolata.AAC.2